MTPSWLHLQNSLFYKATCSRARFSSLLFLSLVSPPGQMWLDHYLIQTRLRFPCLMNLRLQTIAGNYALRCQMYWDCVVLCATASCLKPEAIHSVYYCFHLARPWEDARVRVLRGGVIELGTLLFATVAPAGTTLNIQQVSSTAPKGSSNYRSSQPDSSLPPPSRASLWTLSALHVWVRGVNENQWEREKARTLHLKTRLLQNTSSAQIFMALCVRQYISSSLCYRKVTSIYFSLRLFCPISIFYDRFDMSYGDRHQVNPINRK